MRWFRFSKADRVIPGWLKMVIWLVFAVLVLRFFAIDSLTVHSPAGKPLLQPGDNILVSKIHYGPRLPFTRHRLPGISRIRRGDLVAFHLPEGDSVIDGMGTVSYYALKRKTESDNDTVTRLVARYRPLERREPAVSRCIGLPGDTISLATGKSVDGRNYDGRNYASLPLSVDYLVEVNNRPLPQDFLTGLGLTASEVQILPGLGYLLPLRSDQVEEVRRRPEVSHLEAYLMEPGRGDYNIFPHDARYQWNRDNFGPVIVPKRGDSIRLTLLNLCIYRRIIEVYEENRLEVRQDQIFINGSPASAYTVGQDYYFVLGDNRHHSGDSRHWGFLPADHVIGKAVLIWFSATRTTGQSFRIYWNRIFNTL